MSAYNMLLAYEESTENIFFKTESTYVLISWPTCCVYLYV